MFTRSGATWSQQGPKLTVKAGEQAGEGGVGWAVSLSSNGNIALLGAPFDNSGRGAVWVFARAGEKWTQQGGKLVGGPEQSGTAHSVERRLSSEATPLSSAGRKTTIGAGAAWVFTRSGRPGPAGRKAHGHRRERGGGFGYERGAVLGRQHGARRGPFNAVGAAWVFTRSGGKWTQQGYHFTGSGGDAVALSADGNTAVTVEKTNR